MNKASSGQLNLPLELILSISQHLDDRSIANLRQACTHTNGQLDETFYRRVFTKRTFMIEHESLTGLLDLVKNPTLASYIRILTFDTHVFPESLPQSRRDGAVNFRVNRLDGGFLPREVIISTGQAHAMLVRGFTSLHNLDHINIRNYGHTQRPWGWSYSPFPVHPGQDFFASRRTGFPDDSQPERLFPLILSALAESPARPTSISVRLRKEAPKLNAEAFAFSNKKVVDILKNLKHLDLPISLSDHDLALLRHDHWDPDTSAVLEAPLRTFINHLSSIETLELEFTILCPLVTTFLHWFGGLPRMDDLPPHLSPPAKCLALTRLEIRGATINSTDVLLAISTRFQLIELKLDNIALQGELNSAESWRVFFDLLAKRLEPSTSIQKVKFRNFGLFFEPLDVAAEQIAAAVAWKLENPLRLRQVIKYNARRTQIPIHKWLTEVAREVYAIEEVDLSFSDADAGTIREEGVDSSIEDAGASTEDVIDSSEHDSDGGQD